MHRGRPTPSTAAISEIGGLSARIPSAARNFAAIFRSADHHSDHASVPPLACNCVVADQLPLELGQRAEDLEDQASARGCGVDGRCS